MFSQCLFLAYVFLQLFIVCEAQPTDGNATSVIVDAINTPPKRGWTSGPNGRGTIDIIYSCGITMFLCSWSVLCLNVPAEEDSPFRVFRRRVYVTALAFLGPEFLFQIALGQLISARNSVQQFRNSGRKEEEWTMTHAFYADMGGFKLYSKDFPPFPVDAKQVHYLWTEGYIEFPAVDREEIRDKNKVDGLLRIFTTIQIVWFVVDMAGRRAQNLTITCGELTAAAFIVCSFGTVLCWRHKPADVTTSVAITTNATMAEIICKAGDRAAAPYSRTPLDFVSRKEWPWSIYWSNWINILRCLGIKFGPQVRPVDRFENTHSLELPGNSKWIFFGVTAAYSGVFVAGWNYSFPTSTELLLWRAAASTMCACLVTYWLVTEFGFVWWPWLEKKFRGAAQNATEVEKVTEPLSLVESEWRTSKLRYAAACVRNNTVSQDPQFNVPLKAMLPIYVVGVFYCHARTYLFIADIIQLRSLPASAYDTVDWSKFFPHF
ncbi:hypothetical protein BP5796_05386 [Coleophoma crateriformis]|uniref:Wax synthase domain-containing protein n=1 Tax=Coleophoma crateriformis TaxID=565419 RepID=A0A3D8S344_9HELO|nr:hypothetical protein BP5796_05386 [Coleophoma crateriformis]